MKTVKLRKYIAIDGRPCKSKEEVEAHNKKVRRLLLPDEIKQKFVRLMIREREEWFHFNVIKKYATPVIDILGYRWLSE